MQPQTRLSQDAGPVTNLYALLAGGFPADRDACASALPDPRLN